MAFVNGSASLVLTTRSSLLGQSARSARSAQHHARIAARRPSATLAAPAASAEEPESTAAVTSVEVAEPAGPADCGPYDPSGMTVDEFFARSMGEWRTQRSSHNLVWSQFEAVTSEIAIVERASDDPEVLALCVSNDVDPANAVISVHMSWEGESDWDDEVEAVSGETLMTVVKDTPTTGRLLRSQGYAETIPAVGKWVMTPDGAFVLNTFYDMAAAEERIWFATPDLRLRVSNIRTASGKGVVTASFASEIRVNKKTAG
jgi:phycoerythrin-associated linker protein